MLAKRMITETHDTDKRARLREIIGAQSLLKNRDFQLSSGRRSNYYFDMKKTTLDPEGGGLVADLVFEMVRQEGARFIGGLAMGAIPIVTAVSIRSWPGCPIRAFYVRDEIKDHGTQELIYGFIENGGDVVLVDDVTTEGRSVMKAVAAVRQHGCRVLKVITVVDRLEGAERNFKEAGVPFVPIFTTRDFD
jgi:orotate phosphoribosyltransferase